MKNHEAPEDHTTHPISLMACVTGLAVALILAPAQPAHADAVTPPAMPTNIQVPAGHKAVLVGHAVGTQNYICLPSGASFAWILFGPQATLFTDNDRQVITHFLSANLVESGTPRATWQHSRDTSSVWGLAIGVSSDSAFVAPGAIPWLLLREVGHQDGPANGHTLSATTYIQRLNTSGGTAPATGCSQATDVGKRALVPYTADYFFYEAEHGN